MKSKHWLMLTSLVGVLVAIMVVADLSTKSINAVNPASEELMKTAEDEFGLERGDTLSELARAHRLASRATGQIGVAMQRHADNLRLLEGVKQLDYIEARADSMMRNREPVRVPSK